jgi:hypothetical protein
MGGVSDMRETSSVREDDLSIGRRGVIMGQNHGCTTMGLLGGAGGLSTGVLVKGQQH